MSYLRRVFGDRCRVIVRWDASAHSIGTVDVKEVREEIGKEMDGLFKGWF